MRGVGGINERNKTLVRIKNRNQYFYIQREIARILGEMKDWCRKHPVGKQKQYSWWEIDGIWK